MTTPPPPARYPLALATDADKPALFRMVSLAFGGTMPGVDDWITTAGLNNQRVLRSDAGGVASCLLRIEMGQYWGGRSVPMLGVAGVAVAPESRGKGSARRMMQEFVRSAYDEGWPTAALFASTHTLYRQVGFEHAGSRFEYTVPLSRIDVREREGEVIALTEADTDRIKACYAKAAILHDGFLDRGPYIWQRIRKRWGSEYNGFGVLAPGAIASDPAAALVGYVFIGQNRRPTGRFDVEVNDFVFLDAAAGRRLWGFLADFEMMGYDLTMFGGPAHPALTLLQQHRYEAKLKDYWLIRLTHVEKALSARGYPRSVRTEVHLDIDDALIPGNTGKWVLRVENGRGVAERGGRGDIKVSTRALASLYSGFVSFAQAKALGWCNGDAESLANAEGIFGRGNAWMAEMF